MPHATPSAFARRVRHVLFAIVVLTGAPPATTGAWAADMPFPGEMQPALPPVAGGGGYWAPRVPMRPAPMRFDIYGYPLFGPGLLGRPAPHALGVGCPLALEPAYDPDGNLAGYAPLQYCR